MASHESEYTTGTPFELPERERKLILAHMPPLPGALTAAARAKVSKAVDAHLSAVEALTAFLDVIDGDENLEPYLAGSNGAMDDREQDAGDEGEAGADDDLTCEDIGGEPYGGCEGVL